MEFGSYLEIEPLWKEAVNFVRSTGKSRISSLQRHLRIGYNRAAMLLERMEQQGIVSPMYSDGRRRILVSAPAAGGD